MTKRTRTYAARRRVPTAALAAAAGILAALTIPVAAFLVATDDAEPAPATTVTTSTATTTTVITEGAPVSMSDLPDEVRVYTTMARGLVDAGAVPVDAVTPDMVAADVEREYGIALTDAEAAQVVREILR